MRKASAYPCDWVTVAALIGGLFLLLAISFFHP